MEYKVTRLKEITKYISRGITPKYTEELNGICVVNQKCIRDYKLLLENSRVHDINKKGITSEKIIQKYDILINSTGVGTAGRVAQNFEDKPFTADSHVTIVRPNSSKIDPCYLGYALKKQQKFIEGLAEGSTGQTEISRQRIGEEILIKYPTDLKIQKKIANILLSIDKKIETNNQINDNLQELINNLYIKYFVNFDEYCGEYKESDLGLIPNSFEVDTLGNVITFSNGYGWNSKDMSDNKIEDSYKVFKMGNINIGGGINKAKTKSWIKKDKANNLEQYISKKGDILMCMTDMKNSGNPLLGHTALIDKDGEFVINQRVGIIRCNKKLGYSYIYTLSNLKHFIKDIRSRANSGVQVNLTTKGICDTLVLVPDDVTLKKFQKAAEPLYEKIFNNNNENEVLEQLRDTLLPKLMNGEIDLDKIEV